MRVTVSDDFDLGRIAASGQCFRVRRFPDGMFRFVTGSHVLYIRPEGGENYSVSCTEPEWNEVWTPYFDLTRDYRAIRRGIPPTDVFMRTAAREGAGIRILRQEPWEMLVSFIISQRKNIPAIQYSIELLAEMYGSPAETEYERLFLFPTAEQLRPASLSALGECRVGYRAPYIMSAVALVTGGELDLEALAECDDETLFRSLKTVKGVGDKVANCVCLFAYGRTAVAPVDTWIARIIQGEYGGVDPFPAYGNAAGIMQQYAFFSAQSHKKE